MTGVDKETLSEYLVTYEYLTEKIERLDNRIEELVSDEKYKEKFQNTGCFLGIKVHTVLSIIVEIIDGAVCEDYIHLSVAIPPKYSTSKFMEYLKGKSTLIIYDRHPELQSKWDKAFWFRG